MKTHRWLPLALCGLTAAACDVMSPDDPGNLVPRTVAEDESLPAIELNGSRFHAETFGNPQNPVVVFLHGGPGGDYRSMLTLGARHNGYSLVDDYFLVYWDQRGSGLSQRHNRTTLTIDMYMADLDALIDRYSPDRPVYLVGVSWGGMFATGYINRYPQRVAGAVLIESGPFDGATMERIKDDMFDDDLRREWLNDFAWHSQFISPDTHARMDFERMLGARDAQPNFGTSRTNPEPGWRQGALANRYITKDGQNGKGVFNYDFTTNLAVYTTPVLFIAGARSEVLGESLQREQIERYPAASLTVLDGAGHDVAWIRAADTVELIRLYIAARQGGAQ
jgi:proline iminopeptidase